MASKDFVVRYAMPAEATTEQASAIENLATRANLDDVVRACREHHTSATLLDLAGFTRGWVHADGTYRLQ